MSHLHIGIDLGGTKTEAAAVSFNDEGYQFIRRERIPTDVHRGYEHLVASTASFISRFVNQVGSVPRVGIGMPGSVTSAGLIKNANTTLLNGRPFHADLMRQVNVPLIFANDANCFALAEARYGAARGKRVVFGVIMGTGCGGGLVLDGQIQEGLQSICGEWGHMSLWPERGDSCYCGKQGCTELYLSGTGIETRYAKKSHVRRSLPVILERATQNDQRAVECVTEWMDNFGRALSNVINILDPDIVVLGGGVSNASCLYDNGVAQVRRYVFSDDLLTPIVKYGIGDSAGVLGAALLT